MTDRKLAILATVAFLICLLGVGYIEHNDSILNPNYEVVSVEK